MGTVPNALLNMAIPSECALLDWIGETIDRPLLREISRNDYGGDSAEHLSAIQTQLAPAGTDEFRHFWVAV